MRKLHQLTTIALLGSGMFTALSAQPRVVPIKVITRPGSIGYNDCWGYTTPDKRDFALLGDQDGLMLIEATDAPPGDGSAGCDSHFSISSAMEA